MKRKRSRSRRANGKFRTSYWNNFLPVLALIMFILAGYIVQQYFKKEPLLSPCENNECSFNFQVRAMEIESEVEVFETPKTQREEIVSYIFEVFGNDAVEAIVIIRKCENSRFDPKATNWNRNGTWDTGIFQVNQVHGYSLEQMQDWKQNIDAAKKIFDRAGDWSPWSCSHEVGVTPFYLK
jgi:hypothetical protein